MKLHSKSNARDKAIKPCSFKNLVNKRWTALISKFLKMYITHTESEEGASLRKKQGRLQEVGVTCLQKLWFQQSWPRFPHYPILYYA